MQLYSVCSIKRFSLLSDCGCSALSPRGLVYDCWHFGGHVAVVFRVRTISTLKIEAAGSFSPSGCMMLQTMRPQFKALLPRRSQWSYFNAIISDKNLIYVHLAERSSVVVYAVVGSAIVSILGIIAFVTGAIIIKHKKESDKMRKQQVWHM